jgi:hypothetical protein
MKKGRRRGEATGNIYTMGTRPRRPVKMTFWEARDGGRDLRRAVWSTCGGRPTRSDGDGHGSRDVAGTSQTWVGGSLLMVVGQGRARVGILGVGALAGMSSSPVNKADTASTMRPSALARISCERTLAVYSKAGELKSIDCVANGENLFILDSVYD